MTATTTKPTTTITGSSDDLIDVAGQLYEEFPHMQEEAALLAFSDGTLLEVVYDQDGIWRIRRLASGTSEFEFTAGSAEDDECDSVTLHGDLRWVVKAERTLGNPCFATKGGGAK